MASDARHHHRPIPRGVEVSPRAFLRKGAANLRKRCLEEGSDANSRRRMPRSHGLEALVVRLDRLEHHHVPTSVGLMRAQVRATTLLLGGTAPSPPSGERL